ncbi:hypothetical protein BU14_2434s0001 [Porphyra umbilicalis]|uniref:Uncharacterized protein n=1 Tax=Porphyra umbilicalis TaxID=2786 RepID=A0A1X6NJC6_PORUM|nr:hypothetical protein BU14_2434s0001 [Porphyra umbilicalis]|eukprot:OSX68652.1 hypothetical protein BU14_2434s0001 [Porphyra umbilicalis]
MAWCQGRESRLLRVYAFCVDSLCVERAVALAQGRGGDTLMVFHGRHQYAGELLQLTLIASTRTYPRSAAAVSLQAGVRRHLFFCVHNGVRRLAKVRASPPIQNPWRLRHGKSGFARKGGPPTACNRGIHSMAVAGGGGGWGQPALRTVAADVTAFPRCAPVPAIHGADGRWAAARTTEGASSSARTTEGLVVSAHLVGSTPPVEERMGRLSGRRCGLSMSKPRAERRAHAELPPVEPPPPPPYTQKAARAKSCDRRAYRGATVVLSGARHQFHRRHPLIGCRRRVTCRRAASGPVATAALPVLPATRCGGRRAAAVVLRRRHLQPFSSSRLQPVGYRPGALGLAPLCELRSTRTDRVAARVWPPPHARALVGGDGTATGGAGGRTPGWQSVPRAVDGRLAGAAARYKRALVFVSRSSESRAITKPPTPAVCRLPHHY